MNAKFQRALLNLALATAIGVLAAGLSNGQVNPAATAGGQAAPSGQAQKTEPPPPPQALNGKWKLNADKSDDADEKLRGTPGQETPDDVPSVPSTSQSASSGGGRRSGGNGVPYGRPGGGGPMGGPLATGEDVKTHERMLELLRPTATLAVEVKENEFDLTDDKSQKRTLFTDGRKLQKSRDDSYREIAALWNAGRLSFDEKGPRGEKITVTFQLARDTRELIETTLVDYSKIYSPVAIRYVYDPAPDVK